MTTPEILAALAVAISALSAALYKLYSPKTIPEPSITPSAPPMSPVEPVPVPAPTIPTFYPKIISWAKAIAMEEGAQPRLNNPGNLKLSTLTASWGGTKGFQALDGGWICQFPTYVMGFNALCDFLTLACEGQLIISHPRPCSLQDFTVRYAGNPPQEYINKIGLALNVPLTVDIWTFIS